MRKSEYIKRVLPVINQLGEERSADIIDKIEAYFADAGEENEAAAMNALGIPELFARKFVHTDGDYEIPPFNSDDKHGRSTQKTHSEHIHSKPRTQPERPAQKALPADEPKPVTVPARDNKKMIITLAIFVVTSPIWLGFMALFTLIALVFAFAVAAILLTMTIGGAALTVLGVIRLFSLMPVGLVLTGAGLLLLGIASIAFLPLLKSSVRLLCGTVKDIYIFARRIVNSAVSSGSEVSGS